VLWLLAIGSIAGCSTLFPGADEAATADAGGPPTHSLGIVAVDTWRPPAGDAVAIAPDAGTGRRGLFDVVWPVDLGQRAADDAGSSEEDAGPPDAVADVGDPGSDAGPADDVAVDAAADVFESDTADPDAGGSDAGELHTADLDVANLDVSEPDAAEADTAALDAGEQDTSAPDTGEPDTTNPDAETMDAGPIDGGGPDVDPNVESCDKIDNDGDGLIDEDCLPAPNLSAGQVWLDRGLYENAFGPQVGPLVAGTLPAEGHRMLAVARDQSPKAALLWADSLVSPSGASWLSHDKWATSANRGGPAVHVSSLLVGGAPQIPVKDGIWKVGFARTLELPTTPKAPLVAGWVNVSWLLAPKLGNSKASVDLDVYCIGGAPMSAANMAKSPLWTAISKRIEKLWAGAQIEVGTVTFTDVLGNDGKKFLYVDDVGNANPGNEMDDLFGLSGKYKPKSKALSIFLVAALLDKDVPVAAGITGQLGGLAGLPGSRLSGMAIAMPLDEVNKGMKQDPTGELLGDVYGAVIAHELGHFLGLWHPIESDGTLLDPIGDTPQCNAPPGTTVFGSQVCPDAAKNLMFWSYHPKALQVSDGQKTVVRRHPSLVAIP